ncbi:DNA/RNA helicase domain-containing protein [Streptomyces puniciscabiei]
MRSGPYAAALTRPRQVTALCIPPRRSPSHRLRNRRPGRTGRRQIDEPTDVARVPVFLLDEHQVVRPDEMGTVEEIKAAAGAKGLDCHVVPLESQFRCGGSDAYLRWVVHLLGLEPGGPLEWEPDDRMRFNRIQSVIGPVDLAARAPVTGSTRH